MIVAKKDNIAPLSISVADFPFDANYFEELAKKLDEPYRRYEQKLKSIYLQDEKD